MNLNAIGEFGLIRRIAEKFKCSHPKLNVGMGDDCAVFGDQYAVSSDLLIEGIHFFRELDSYRLLGRKALAVNISDIAAMGASPLFFLLSLAIPLHFPIFHVEELLDGIGSMADETGTLLIGGDTTGSGSDLMISITVIGRSQNGRFITRGGACTGDLIQVSGNLGSSAAGLELLKGSSARIGYDDLVSAHLDPIPRVQAGLALNGISGVHAMIDLSDGLVQDLSHIVNASNKGAEIILESLPVESTTLALSKKLCIDPYRWALSGGEDYELCWAVHPDDAESALSAVRGTGLTHAATIGRITDSGKLSVLKDGQEFPLSQTGFDHFCSV